MVNHRDGKPQIDPRTPMERTADLTRRIIAVPRSEVVKPKKAKKRKAGG